MCLTLAHIEPLGYLAQSDAEDPLLLQTEVLGGQAPRLMMFQAAQAVGHLYDSIDALPVEMVYLFRSYNGLSRAVVLDELIRPHPSDFTLDPQRLSIAQLLVISVALKSGDLIEFEGFEGSVAPVLSSAYFTISLSKLWTLLTSTEDRIVLTLFMAHCLIYYWARPFHALGLLQSLHSVIRRFAFKQKDGPYVALLESRRHKLTFQIGSFTMRSSASF